MQASTPMDVKVIDPYDDWIDLACSEHYVDSTPIWGDPRPLSKGWTPSSLGEPNDRLIVAKCLGHRGGDPISHQLQFIFDAGNDIEARWIRRFKEMNCLVDSDVWLPGNRRSGLIIRGKVDLIVRHKYEPERKILIEMKSMNMDMFKSLPKVSRDPVTNFDNLMALKGALGERVHKYMHQIQVYLYEMEYDEGMLFFENKNNQRQMKYSLVQMPGMLDKIFERLRVLQDEYWSRGLLPPWRGSPTSKDLLAVYKRDEVVSVEEMREQFEQIKF